MVRTDRIGPLFTVQFFFYCDRSPNKNSSRAVPEKKIQTFLQGNFFPESIMNFFI